MARIIIQMECTACRNRNYSTNKNKTTTPDRLVLKKYCRHCRKHTEHKETK
ncbi:MAG: 50S ribosomal protein L33 [Deltaproteobacteria bacterium]|nr:50S ribosomal protein L33 [Deltaproteobacteria bacterium]